MLVFVGLSALHLLTIFFLDENPYRVITKILPILYLLYIAITKINSQKVIKKFIILAIAFSCLGDFFLAFKEFFIPGLGSFLIAQIIYSVGFTKEGKLHWQRGVPFYGAGIGLFLYLSSSLPGDLFVPVSIYVIALSTMAWRASAREIPTQHLQWSILGATSFLVSDALIALTKFKNLPLPYPDFLIMVTYYLAQYLLVRSSFK